MTCPHCGRVLMVCAKTGAEIERGDIYDVMPNGDLILQKKAPKPAPAEPTPA